MVQWSEWGNQQRWGKPVRMLATMALLVVLALLLAQTFWLIWSGPQAIPGSDDLPRLNPPTSSSGDFQLTQSQVDRWQLFGRYQASQKPQEEKPTEAPETRLRLQLLGVFQASDPEQATAIIAEKGKEGEVYHVGDSIPGNATLEEVYPDRVILRRAGRLETLRWSEEGLQGVSAVHSQSPSSPQPRASEEQARSGPAALLDMELSEQRRYLVGQLGLEPVKAGESRGYRIGERAPKQLIAQVGLNADDVIVSVNGYSLGTKSNDMAALRSYRESGSATIVVERGDQQFTVNFPP